MSKFCAECGSPINENAKFCRVCGAPQKVAPPVTPTEPARQPVRPKPEAAPAKKPAGKPINKVTITIIAAAAVVILACILIFTGGKEAAVDDTPAADNSQTTENTPTSPENEPTSSESEIPPAPGTTDSETAVPEVPADDTSKIRSTEEFIDWLQGYWVHLDGARVMYDHECMFETVFYEGTDSYYVFHPGGYDAPGKVKDVKQISDDVFEYTEYYEAYMGPDGEQPEAMYTITVYVENGPTRAISYDASKSMKWTYMGATLEEANENVYAYLTSPQTPQEPTVDYSGLVPCQNWDQMSEDEKLFAAAGPLADAISDSTDDPKSHVGFLNTVLDEVEANGLGEEPIPVVMMIDDAFIEHYGVEPYIISREDYITIILKDTNAGEEFQWDFDWQYEILGSPGFTIQEFLTEMGIL